MKPDPCSDDRLRRCILTGLARDNRTAFADLRVAVVGSIAHLTGLVSSMEISIAAAEITGSIPGISGVVNRIEMGGQIQDVHFRPRQVERVHRDQWRHSEESPG